MAEAWSLEADEIEEPRRGLALRRQELREQTA